MTRINDVVKIVAPYLDDRHGEPEAKALHMIHALADAGLLIPSLPAPDNSYPEWLVGSVSISPGPDAGEVAIEWEDREDTGRGTVARSLYLAPDQVRALLAAADYAEKHTKNP